MAQEMEEVKAEEEPKEKEPERKLEEGKGIVNINSFF